MAISSMCRKSYNLKLNLNNCVVRQNYQTISVMFCIFIRRFVNKRLLKSKIAQFSTTKCIPGNIYFPNILKHLDDNQ
ncbi:hypothetical protein BLOT_011178 [Blomia tropicalis]|nr:hypothetical protein BLOT_011178 [Blomia tropicalis]